MKEDHLFVVIFLSLLAILALGLMPRYSGEATITGTAVSPPATSSIWIIIVVIIVVIALIGAIAYFFIRKPSFKKVVSESSIPLEQPRLPIEKPRTPEQKLHNYVQHSIAQGKSSSQVRHALLAVGWPKETIEKVMKKL